MYSKSNYARQSGSVGRVSDCQSRGGWFESALWQEAFLHYNLNSDTASKGDLSLTFDLRESKTCEEIDKYWLDTKERHLGGLTTGI